MLDYSRGARQCLTLLAKSLESKSSKARDAGCISRDTHKKCEQTGNINSSSSDDMLKMRLYLSNIATPAQVEGTHSLGESSFNPCTHSVTIFKFLSGLSLPGRLNGFMLSL